MTEPTKQLGDGFGDHKWAERGVPAVCEVCGIKSTDDPRACIDPAIANRSHSPLSLDETENVAYFKPDGEPVKFRALEANDWNWSLEERRANAVWTADDAKAASGTQQRPSLDAVYPIALLQAANDEIAQLKDTIAEKDAEIERLKAELRRQLIDESRGQECQLRYEKTPGYGCTCKKQEGNAAVAKLKEAHRLVGELDLNGYGPNDNPQAPMDLIAEVIRELEGK